MYLIPLLPYILCTNSDFLYYISGLGSGPLDVRIKRLAEERDDLQDNVRRLKMDLDEEKNRSQVSYIMEKLYFVSKICSDLL